MLCLRRDVMRDRGITDELRDDAIERMARDEDVWLDVDGRLLFGDSDEPKPHPRQ
jgi:hypothetical protein